MSGPSDIFTGVKCFTIGGRMINRRNRCMGMTDEERTWRAQFLKDQILDPEEPRFVPEHYKSTTNFFRRLYKTPMRKLMLFLEPIVGYNKAYTIRHIIGKGGLTLAAAYVFTYFAKYHSNDFTTYRTVEIYVAQQKMYPDHPDYPNIPEKKPSDYHDQGFYSSILCQDIKYEEPPPPPPPPPPTRPTVRSDGSDIICPKPEDETEE